MKHKSERQIAFGAHLRTVRQALPISLRALAKRSGVSASVLCRIENGYDCSMSDLEALADGLGIRIAIGNIKGEELVLDPNETRMLLNLRNGKIADALFDFLVLVKQGEKRE